jgi:hypothetical protein
MLNHQLVGLYLSRYPLTNPKREILVREKTLEIARLFGTILSTCFLRANGMGAQNCL